MLDWSLYPNFKRSEFDSADLVGSGDRMNPEFMQRLQCAREAADIPFKITSGYRTPARNQFVGGVSDSSHVTGFAADIACSNDAERFRIVCSLLDAGFNRIGIAKSFVHVDNDPTKNAERIWVY